MKNEAWKLSQLAIAGLMILTCGATAARADGGPRRDLRMLDIGEEAVRLTEADPEIARKVKELTEHPAELPPAPSPRPAKDSGREDKGSVVITVPEDPVVIPVRPDVIQSLSERELKSLLDLVALLMRRRGGDARSPDKFKLLGNPGLKDANILEAMGYRDASGVLHLVTDPNPDKMYSVKGGAKKASLFDIVFRMEGDARVRIFQLTFYTMKPFEETAWGAENVFDIAPASGKILYRGPEQTTDQAQADLREFIDFWTGLKESEVGP